MDYCEMVILSARPCILMVLARTIKVYPASSMTAPLSFIVKRPAFFDIPRLLNGDLLLQMNALLGLRTSQVATWNPVFISRKVVAQQTTQ
jgi:hypothetical protein